MQKKHRIYSMTFSYLYPFYVTKAEKKGHSKDEVNEIIHWLTGYTQQQLEKLIDTENTTTVEEFFDQAPALHENRHLIKGRVCGVKIEDVQEPLMKEIRYLDKLIDELVKGKAMEKILRHE